MPIAQDSLRIRGLDLLAVPTLIYSEQRVMPLVGRAAANPVGDNCDPISEIDGSKEGCEDADIGLGARYDQAIPVSSWRYMCSDDGSANAE